MKAAFRFRDWPLRAKIVALLAVASLLPLLVTAVMDISEARERLVKNTAALLAARGDQLANQLDTFHRGYLRSVNRISRFPAAIEFCQAGAADLERLKPPVQTILKVFPGSDPAIRGTAILDLQGTVRVATEKQLVGVDLSYRHDIREALGGAVVISDLYLAEVEVGAAPTIAYLTPVLGPGKKPIGAAVIWVRAAALWDIMKASNELAGPGSFAVLFDHLGIRIAHTYSTDIIFHPGGRLASATVDELVTEHRFGAKTRELLEDVRPFPEQFDRATSKSPELGVFRGLAPVNQLWTYGVARRFETVPWTVFYMLPEPSLEAQITEMRNRKIIFAVAIILTALLVGTIFAAFILQPIGLLSSATESLARGDLAARVGEDRADELGQLGRSFNAMAGRLEVQATALQTARDELELRVRQRTAELVQTTKNLEVEIAERRRHETALRESQERLHAIVATALDGIITMDHAGRIVDFNPAAERIFQCRSAEVQGRVLADVVIPPALRERHRQGLAQYLATGQGPVLGQRVELTALRADGSEFPVELSITRIGATEPPLFTGFVRDITGRKGAENKLQAQLERLNLLHQITRAIGERQDLRSIFQVVLKTLEEQQPIDFSCVCLFDPAAALLTVNSVGVRSKDLAKELALTEQVRVAVDENGLSHCVRGQLVYEPDLSQVPFPFPQRLAQGGLRSLVAAPLLVESKVFGVLLVARREAHRFSSGECEFLRQLSEHVALAAHQAQLHGALQEAFDELRQTQHAVLQQERLRSLGQMASGIAHDINNAISPAALYLESLLKKEPNLSAHAREYLETVQRAVEDVAATVARMREFYRQREPQVTLTVVFPNRLIQQVVDLTRPRWSDLPQQGGSVIKVRTELPPDLPAIMGSESEIREALTNLIFNAVDAMPDGGTLTLRTSVTEAPAESEEMPPTRFVRIEVVDTGMGMDEDTRRRCLEPFFTTKGERGTGLGLAMVYGVMQRHGAEVEIESTEGQGTTIRLIFPVPHASTTGLTRAPKVYAVPAHLRILVVDDDPILLKSLRDTLESDGHVVVTANGGQLGMDAFRAAHERGEPYAAVITDFGMPAVDGRQVASAVKTLSPSTPVILLTGWGQRLVAEGEVPPHVDCVLSKPPKLKQLYDALAHLCGAAKS